MKGRSIYMIKRGGIEVILTAIILIALVIALIATAVKDVANSGEAAIQQGIDNLAGKQVTMGTN